jgi:importin subunit beta-1
MEDAFLAVGAMTTALEGDFARYIEPFAPFLQNALQTYEEHQMCCIAVGLVGDICRALNDKVVVYCEGFIQQIGALLQNNNVHRSIKPACLSCIGDIALAIGGKFEAYLHPVMAVISQLAASLDSIPQVHLLIRPLRSSTSMCVACAKA